jgi:hypothetical protein
MSDEKNTPLTDAIGQPLVIGDFVTAVWEGGDVALFEVAGFKTNVKTSSRYWARRGDVLMLKRLFSDKDVSEKTQQKLAKKMPSQVTKVSADAVMMYKLSN